MRPVRNANVTLACSGGVAGGGVPGGESMPRNWGALPGAETNPRRDREYGHASCSIVWAARTCTCIYTRVLSMHSNTKLLSSPYTNGTRTQKSARDMREQNVFPGAGYAGVVGKVLQEVRVIQVCSSLVGSWNLDSTAIPHKFVQIASSMAMDSTIPPLDGSAVLMQPSERYQSDTPKAEGEYSAASWNASRRAEPMSATARGLGRVRSPPY